MIMRVSWGKIRPGMWDRFEQLWKESAARMDGTAGLAGHWLLRDTEQENAGYSMSLWESAAAMNAASEMRQLTPEMNDCFTGQYVLTTCEVRGTEPAGLPGS